MAYTTSSSPFPYLSSHPHFIWVLPLVAAAVILLPSHLCLEFGRIPSAAYIGSVTDDRNSSASGSTGSFALSFLRRRNRSSARLAAVVANSRDGQTIPSNCSSWGVCRDLGGCSIPHAKSIAFLGAPVSPIMRFRSSGGMAESFAQGSSPQETVGIIGEGPIGRQEEVRLFNQSEKTPLAEGSRYSRSYCESLRETKRFPSRTIFVGNVAVGSAHPIRCQTMTTSDTRDVDATVAQVIRCADEGADLVRLTVQGVKEAQACAGIREKLDNKGYTVPLVADIHFNPKIAMLVADSVQKIRVNPGNFADGLKKWEEKSFDDESAFAEGRDRIEELFTPIVEKCIRLKRAIRIGTNHGSLSSRILGYYGDTPKGMVESAFEFATICRKHNFHDFIFSMKASNPVVMVQAYRRLVAEQYAINWDYPIHLGVTEAGEGEDGRIKSALGIGALLQDGIGDTIRVSLTEDPWYELAPCKRFAELAHEKCLDTSKAAAVPAYTEITRDITSFQRREVQLPHQEVGDQWDVKGILHRDGSVITPVTLKELHEPDTLYRALGCKLALGMPVKGHGTSDSVFLNDVPSPADLTARLTIQRLQDAHLGVLVPLKELQRNPLANAVAEVPLKDVASLASANGTDIRTCLPQGVIRVVSKIEGDETEEQLEMLKTLQPVPQFIVFSPPSSLSYVHSGRRLFDWLKRNNSQLPVIHHMDIVDKQISAEDCSLLYTMEMGALLVDGLGDGVMLGGHLATKERCSMAFNVLQAARMRSTKTEYISCPSCGRTLFDLQEVTDQIRRRTGHLPGVAIAVMGCIVNGVGEMADADFGYVGGAPGMVDLYVGKKVVQRGIPNDEACDKLIDLIKLHGRWVNPIPETNPEHKNDVQVATEAT